MLLKKRFLSSPFAFGMTLSHYLSSKAGRGLSDDEYDDLFGEGQADEEEGLWEQDETTKLRESKGSDPLIAAEPGQLDALIEWGLSYESRADSRLDRLIKHLDAICRPDGKHWSNERVVVFTEYAHTVDWLTRVRRGRGCDGKEGELDTRCGHRQVLRHHRTRLADQVHRASRGRCPRGAPDQEVAVGLPGRILWDWPRCFDPLNFRWRGSSNPLRMTAPGTLKTKER